MREETEDNADADAAAYAASGGGGGGGGEESQSKPLPASPETVPPGFEPHRSPSPPPPGFESYRPPVPPPVSQESQLIPVMSLSQSVTQTREGNKDMDGGSVTVAYESPSESMASSPDTAPPGWEAHRSPSPPPPTSLPVSKKSQLEPVGSSCQALSLLNVTRTTGEETEGNKNKDDGSVTVSQEFPSKPTARLPETAPPSWESLCPPSLLSPPPPTPLPVSEESQLIPAASSSQALSLLNVAQTMGEETKGNENKDGGSVTVSQESPSKPMASMPGTALPGLESLRPPSPLPSPLVPTLFPDSQEPQLKPVSSLPETASTNGESSRLPSWPSTPPPSTLPAHEICLAECGKCEVLLMYQHGAPAVRCSHCNFVTKIGEHNSRTLDSVLQGYPLQPQIPVYESTQLSAVAVQKP